MEVVSAVLEKNQQTNCEYWILYMTLIYMCICIKIKASNENCGRNEKYKIGNTAKQSASNVLRV